MNILKTLIATSTLLLMTAPASAGGDAERGKELSTTCAACHGTDGNSPNPMYPILAGQYEDYLVHSLKAYKSGDRQNAIMAGFAASLSEQDMEDLAAYFASQDSKLSILPEK